MNWKEKCVTAGENVYDDIAGSRKTRVHVMYNIMLQKLNVSEKSILLKNIHIICDIW